ncbi:hypothetical protein M7I_7797 [Glarea lozoyensis 74030]|uniref:Uncharacterized protein n=1 Tax=Glarea lozoyensis (strain ATCC 74030 / MF5533) TaxID=1104152 RepID=H0EY99_GLAL7|nr:hypothetical protein M7I_7797 [Glarea lozoyensis 74030]
MATVSDWGLEQAPPFQSAAVPTTSKTSEAAKFLENFTDIPLDLFLHPPKSETSELSVDKPLEKISAANTSSKTQQKNPSQARSFDADPDSEEFSDTDSEEYRMAKEREYWLSLPSAENGGGLTDKPAGIFGRIFGTFTGKKTKAAEEKKDASGSTVGSKSESDEESFNTAREEWVHVANNRNLLVAYWTTRVSH